MTNVFIQNDDGDWVPFGEAVSIVYTIIQDGVDVAPGGACPQCRTVPLDGQPYLCPHGVTLPGSPLR